MDPKNHPAITVTNIKNFVPVVLDGETELYTQWSEFFRIHSRAYDVSDHLLPRAGQTPATDDAGKAKQAADDDIWFRLDTIVLQWIYGTISSDLFTTVLKKDTTAAAAWAALEGVFNDNKHTRALHLEKRFTNCKLDDFSNMSAYCQELKRLSDLLANVEAPVTNDRLVLQLISGLSEAYDGVASHLQQLSPLPEFSVARSKVILEKTRKSVQASNSAAASATALAAVATAAPPPPQQQAPTNYRPPNRNSNGKRGKGRQNRGRAPFQAQSFSPWAAPQQPNNFRPLQQNWAGPQGWAQPPCPYPTASYSRPGSSPAPGILGPRPAQSYAVSEVNQVPTELDQAFNTMSLYPPDQQWYLDSGASQHMTHNPGNFKYYLNSSSKHILVDNGATIQIHATRHSKLKPPLPPLSLFNILYAPHLVKNLISVHRLTTDNNISIEFDPFGFTVKDLATRNPILRCDSKGELYPFTFSSSLASSRPSAFAAVSRDTWHQRLGHLEHLF